MTTATATAAATEKQVAFARNLYREIRDLGVNDAALESLGESAANAMNDRKAMSGVIDAFITVRDGVRDGSLAELVDPAKAPAPRQPAAPQHDVPEGRYAITDNMDGETNPTFIQVDRPTEGKWAGYVFVKRLVGAPGDFAKYGVKDRTEREAMLAKVAADPQAAAIAFGRLVGVCGVCGSPLTNEASREYGIGPVCREKTGW